MSDTAKKAQFIHTAPTSQGQKVKISGPIIDTYERVEQALLRLAIVEKQLELGTTFYNEEIPLPEPVKEFDALLGVRFLPLLLLAGQIGLALEDQMEQLYSLVSAVRAVINAAATCKRPASPEQTLAAVTERSKLEFKSVEKYNSLQNLLQFLATAFLWVAEADPVAFLKKYELEVTDLVAGLNRCQNPLYLKFAEAAEQFLKELLSGYVTKHFKTGLVWKETGGDVVLPLQFSVFGSQAILSFSTPPARTAARLVDSKTVWTCEFQGADTSNKRFEYECKAEKVACLIYSCYKTHVTIRGKPDSVRIENCENVTVVLEHVATAVDVVCSRNIEIIAASPAPSNNANTATNASSSTAAATHVLPIVNVNLTSGLLIAVSDKAAGSEMQVNSVVSTRVYVQIGSKVQRISESSKFSVKLGSNDKIVFK